VNARCANLFESEQKQSGIHRENGIKAKKTLCNSFFILHKMHKRVWLSQGFGCFFSLTQQVVSCARLTIPAWINPVGHNCYRQAKNGGSRHGSLFPCPGHGLFSWFDRWERLGKA
jgi:hypothetical protein